MNVILVRHAIAEDRRQWSKPDHLRPLVPRGVERFTLAAKGLASYWGSIDTIITSPYVRAVETAQILQKNFPNSELKEDKRLACEAFLEDSISLIRDQDPDGNIALVGHEPNLSELLAHLLGAQYGPMWHLKKGSATCVELTDNSGEGALLWALPPAVLRSLS